MMDSHRQWFFAPIVVFCFSSIVVAQSVESLMNTGSEMLQRGGYSQAVTAFRKVLQREPDHFEAQYNLGFAYLQWGRYSNAAKELKKAVALYPRSSQAWSNLAVAYENQGSSENAIGALLEAVKLDPGNLTARVNLAAMYANANRLSEAITQYKQVIAIDNSDETTFLNLSKCLISNGDYGEAKKYLGQALVLNSTSGEIHWELGNIYWKNEDDLEKAISEFKRAVGVASDNPKYYESLAYALDEQGKTDDARKVLEKSLVYIDDALQKEKIRDRIKRWELGVTPADTSTSKENSSIISVPAGGIEKMKKDTYDRNNSGDTIQRIKTSPIDIMGDFKNLQDSDEEDDVMDFDDELKKRTNQ